MSKKGFLYFISVLTILSGLAGSSIAQVSPDTEGENILVHSDRNVYISGEIMWFKIYVTRLHTYQLQEVSKTAYAELTGPDGIPVLQAKIEVENGMGTGSFLLPADAKSGNYELRVYTNRMKNQSSTVFKKFITIVNTQQTFDTTAFVFIDGEAGSLPSATFSSTVSGSQQTNSRPDVSFPIKITSDKNIYGRRDIVNLEVQAGTHQEALSSNFSVSVYRANALTAAELPLNHLNAGVTVAEPILQEGQLYLPEVNGFVIVVRVKDLTGKPVSKVPLNLSLSGKLTMVKWGESDEEGFAYFNFKDVYGPRQIFIRVSPEYEGKVQIELMKSFAQPQKAASTPLPAFKNSFLGALEDMHNHLQVRTTFNSSERNQFLPENIDSTSFYGKPYNTYLLDNYKRFVTMEEVLREYVQEVMVRIRGGNYYILMLNKQLSDISRYMEVNRIMDHFAPMVLIDGIPVTPNELMKYDPLKVRKLEVLAERYYLGQNIYDGILSFTTYGGIFEDLSLDKEALLLEEQGWQYTRKFFMPDYTNPVIKNNRIPDFRELLYWEPQLNAGSGNPAKVSFFTGDLTGKFIVEVRGLTTDGRVIHEFLPIQVSGD